MISLSFVLCYSQSCNRLYMFLQPPAQALKARTCSCCLLAADVVISTVFLLAQCSPLFESGWTWPRLWVAPRRKTFAPASVCAGFRKKKKKSGGKCGVICEDEIKLSGHVEAVVPVKAAYRAFIRHVGTVGHGGETCKRICNEAGDWCGLHSACCSKTSSGAVCACFLTDNTSVPDPMLQNILAIGVMDKLSSVILQWIWKRLLNKKVKVPLMLYLLSPIVGHSFVMLQHQTCLVMFAEKNPGLDWIVTYSLVIFPCVQDWLHKGQLLWGGH